MKLEEMFYKCWLGLAGTELNYTIAGSDCWCDIGRYFKKLRRKLTGKLKAILNTFKQLFITVC